MAHACKNAGCPPVPVRWDRTVRFGTVLLLLPYYMVKATIRRTPYRICGVILEIRRSATALIATAHSRNEYINPEGAIWPPKWFFLNVPRVCVPTFATIKLGLKMFIHSSFLFSVAKLGTYAKSAAAWTLHSPQNFTAGHPLHQIIQFWAAWSPCNK